MAYAKNPDYDRMGWINDVIVHLWPHVARAASHMVREQAGPLLQQNKPRCSACPASASAVLKSAQMVPGIGIPVMNYAEGLQHMPFAHVIGYPGKEVV